MIDDMTKTKERAAALAVRKSLRKGEKSDRKPVTLYLSESAYKAFKRACEPVAASAVVEELMREFSKTKS